jgi:hypothetical protein
MKAIKVLGWIFVPFIMIFLSWKNLNTGLRAAGIVWAALAVIIGLGSLSSEEPANQTVKETVTEQKEDVKTETKTEKEPTPAPEPEVEENDPGISKAEFDQLKTGMSYKEAVAIIGGNGEILSESGTPGGTGFDIHTVMYMFEGESGIGANANLMFQGDKLQNKAQFGLK